MKFSREFLGYIMFRKLQAENIIAYLKASLQKLGDPFRVDIFNHTIRRFSLCSNLDKTEHVPPLKTVKSVQFWS